MWNGAIVSEIFVEGLRRSGGAFPTVHGMLRLQAA
jgi:hypothetical protein